MGRNDSTPANLKAVASANEPVDRLNMLGRWITGKLEELTAMEERLAKRTEHLNATEQSLKALFESLRVQVAQTHPVLKELTQLRATALTAVEQVVRASKDRSNNAQQAAAIDKGLEERLANQLATCQQKITQMCQAAEESMARRAGQVDAEMDANLSTLTQYLEHRLLTSQQNVDALANRLADQLRVTEGRTTEIVRSTDMRSAEAITKLRRECEAMVNPIQERLATQLSEIETKLTTDMSTVEETMKAQINGFYLHMDQAGATLARQLANIATDFEQQAEVTLASSRQKVRQQIDAIEDEVRLSVRPIIQGIDDRCASADRHADSILSGMDEALKIRLAELRRSGEAVIQLVETQLIDRVKLLRPQAQAAIDMAQKQVGQQLHLALENVRSSVEMSERQLADRIEDLRPRAAAALQAAKADIGQQIASLELEANTATAWIEQRMNQRIDDLTYRARKTVGEQIRDLDDAAQRLGRREKGESINDASSQSLELDVHVENPQSKRSSAA